MSLEFIIYLNIMEIEFFFDSMENYFDASFMASKRKVNLTPITSSEFIIFLNIMVIEFFVDSMEDSFDTSFMASKREVHLTPITLIEAPSIKRTI